MKHHFLSQSPPLADSCGWADQDNLHFMMWQLCMEEFNSTSLLTISWVVSRESWLAGQGRWFCPSTLLLWDPIWSTAPSSRAPNTRRTWSCWSESRGELWRWSEGWSTSPVRTVWELGLFSLEKSLGGPHNSLPVPGGVLQESWGRTFYKGM